VIQIDAWPGKPIARKLVAPLYHGQFGKYVRRQSTWAVELRERKIRVNAISAGVIPTSAYKAAGLNQAQYDQFVQASSPSIPLGRAGTLKKLPKPCFSWHQTTAVMSTASSYSWTAGWHRFDNGH